VTANYDLPDVVEKRTRFFDGQFLQDQDFVDEQKYHLDRQRRHNRLLHVSGVAEGLTVATPGANRVTVSPGTAIDSDGRQLALAETATVDLPGERFNDKQGIDLYAAYQESAEDRQTGQGSEDFTRWLERPQLLAVPPGDSYAASTPPVLLAKLALDGAGRVTVDEAARSYSGVRLPGRAADPPALRTAPTGEVTLSGRLTVGGSVTVTADTRTVGGWWEALRFDQAEHSAITHPAGGLLFGLHGDRNFYFSDIRNPQADRHVVTIEADTGSVGIGTAPAERLHVSGGKLRLDGNQQVVFADGDTSNNLKLQLWSGYGLGINGGTLFYAANGLHSWRDDKGANERMALSTAADGGLTVRGTGTSSFAGPLQLRRDASAQVSGSWPFLELYQDEWSPARMSDVYPGIRFRHHNHFETTLETRPGAFHLLTGQKRDDYADLWFRRAYATGLSVGTQTTLAPVDVQDAKRSGTHPTSVRGLYVTGDFGDGSGGVEFRHSNATQGIGFGANSIYAAGSNTDQHLNLLPKGSAGVGIGTTKPRAKLDVTGGKIQLDGNQQLVFSDSDTTNNLKLQLWSGYGLGINPGALFYAANGRHSWRDNNGANERMALTTAANGGLTVSGTGPSTFAGNVGIATTNPTSDLQIGDFAARDRYLALKVEGGNAYRSGIKMWAWKENYGYSIQFDERTASPTGLHVKWHDGDADGKTLLFVQPAGNVGVGTTAPQAGLHVNGDIRARDIYATGRFYFEPASNWGTEGGGPRNFWYFRRDNWNLNDLRPGAVSVHASGIAYPSDARLKEQVCEIPSALDRICRLRGVHFTWNADGLRHLARDIEATTTVGPDATQEENEQLWRELREQRYRRLGGRSIGLLAQEVEQVAPELVVSDDEGFKHIDYSRLTAVLVQAVKEQQALIGDLAERLGTIERGA
jgi:hypothetical protein